MKKAISLMLAIIIITSIVLASTPTVSAAQATSNYSQFSAPSSSDYAYWNGSRMVKASGTTTSEVKWMQAAMNACIDYHLIDGVKLSVDGSFGPASKAMTIKFQRATALTQDGSFGPATISKMKQTISSFGNNQQTIINDHSDTPRNGAFVRIRYASNGRYLDVPAEGINNNGTQLQVWDSAILNANQYFQLIDTGSGWQIISLSSGKVIEVRDSSHNDYAHVAQWEKHSLACARWDIICNNDGTVSFRNRESSKYLNVSGGGNAGNGTKIIQFHNDGSVAMRFYIKTVRPNGYQTDTKPIPHNSVSYERDITASSWHPLLGLTKTMLEIDDSAEAIVQVPAGLDALNFALSWITNSLEITKIHVTQGKNQKMTIQYGTPIELNVSGKKLSLSTLLVQRYYNFSPTVVFTSDTTADACIRNWFGFTDSGKYGMELSFGRVMVGDYGYYLLVENGMIYQVPIIHESSTYIVYRTLNGKTSALFDAAPLLRCTRSQMKSDDAIVVMRYLVTNGYIQ